MSIYIKKNCKAGDSTPLELNKFILGTSKITWNLFPLMTKIELALREIKCKKIDVTNSTANITNCTKSLPLKMRNKIEA